MNVAIFKQVGHSLSLVLGVKLFFVTITVPMLCISCPYYLLLSILISCMGTLQNLLGLLKMKGLLCKYEILLPSISH